MNGFTMRLKLRLVYSVCCAAALAVHAEVPSLIAIRDARVVPVKGAAMEKATVIIREGLIAGAGASLAVPAGAYVIDGTGLTVYPGLIDAYSTWGIPQATATAPAGSGRSGGGTPSLLSALQSGQQQPRSQGPQDRPGTNTWVRAADLVRPADSRLEAARSAGFTTAMTFPRGGLIGGHGAAVNLGGETGGAMVVANGIGLQMSFTPSGYSGFPGTQMGMLAYFRQLWLDAAYYSQAKASYASDPTGVKRPEYDRALEHLGGFPRVLLPAASPVQMERALKLAGELKAAPVLYGVVEGYRMAAALKQAGVAVILNSRWPSRQRDADPEQVESLRVLEQRDMAPQSPKALASAGVPFAMSSDGADAPRDVIRALKRAIDLGLSKEDALKALTLAPAEIFGLSSRLGSIENGKVANLTVTDGDLFDERTKVRMVFIDGVKYVPAPQAPQTPFGSGAGGPPGGQRPGEAVEETGEEVIR
jgi:imidazolonepropionase-like amidohydrolase